MNIFVAVLLKAANGERITSEAIEKFLPARPFHKDEWASPSGRVLFFVYTIGSNATESKILANNEGACVYDGILIPETDCVSSLYSKWPLDHLLALDGHNDFAGQGEFSVAWTDGRSLLCRSNLGGSHNLYVTETAKLFAVSNRSVCLLGLPGISHELDTMAVRWKAFHGYVSDGLTAFSAIRKVRNGSLITVAPSGHADIVSPTYRSVLDPHVKETFASNPTRALFSEIDRIAEYMRRGHRALGGLDIDVPLSGGKDSRVILALLIHGGMLGKVSTIWTRGPLYSPEVLAAQDICRAIDYSNHEVRRPALFGSTTVSARTIVGTLNLHEGLLSLFDFCGIEPRTKFRFQGHELGLRAGRFAKCDTSSFTTFVREALATWKNPLNVLLDNSAITRHIERFFSVEHANGTPVEDLGDVYSVFDRLPSWAAVISATDYYGGPISNPLIEGNVIRFALSIPPSFRRGEVFQYLVLLHAAPGLLKIPFAEQVWPSTLEQALKEVGIIEKQPTPVPYKSSPHFPNIRNPYIANIKLEYFNILKPIVHTILDKHRSFFGEFIDLDKFTAQQATVTDPSFQYLYVALGLYSAALMQEYGVALFDRNRQPEIVEELQRRIDEVSSSNGSTSPKVSEQVWLDLIERHERAIAGFVKERQGLPRNS